MRQLDRVDVMGFWPLPPQAWRLLVASALTIALTIAMASTVAADGPALRAVLIGNSYQAPQFAASLQNPGNDALAMEDLLVNRLGVAQAHVTVLQNADRAATYDAWDKAVGELDVGVAVFYFSGHGIEVAGKNYLVPEKAPSLKSEKEFDLQDALVSFDRLVKVLRDQQDKHAGIIGVFILDACRGDPFGDKTKGFGSAGKGLAPARLPQDSETFVMYAAGAGQLALDSTTTEASRNSLYTRYLLAELPDKQRASALGLADLAQNIREKVIAVARNEHHAQSPSYYDQLVQRRSLLGTPLPALSVAEVKDKLPTVEVVAVATKAPVASADASLPVDCDGCPSLVAVPAGRFGQTAIPALAFGKTEVTNREWNVCVKNGGCQGYRGFSYLPDTFGRYRENRPVTNVTWVDARAYVDWLSRVTKQKYRLPTEAEWEYAAQSGSTGPYSFGDKIEQLCEYANGADQSLRAAFLEAAPCKDGYARETAPVASFRANGFGLHDMHGNVWEWVDGCWKAGAAAEQHCDRIARGGSWRSPPQYLRSSSRTTFPEKHARSTLGFRVVRELTP